MKQSFKRSMKIFVLSLAVMMLAAFALPAMASDAPDETIMIGADAVLYRTDGSIQVWTPDTDGTWNPVISLSTDELDALPDTPDSVLTLATAGNLALYKLTNGQYQVNNGVHKDGKTQVVV
ncbi:MAG TPA: hypothetical protein VHL11_09665, partial [Phototrophicaceae bacterium]|nr:hypothetical protein [Phototrophicaceae bacterium]